MSGSIATLRELVGQLSPDLQQEVIDFVEFLLEKQARKREERTRVKPKFDWAGALMDLRDQYTSVELQHRILDWRTGEQ